MSEYIVSAEGNRVAAPHIVEGQMQTRAYRDAMRAIATDVPDAAIYARYMPLREAEMLMKAKHTDAYRVSIEAAKILRPLGLVEAGAGGRCLTAFGMAVRRALIAGEA